MIMSFIIEAYYLYICNWIKNETGGFQLKHNLNK